LSKYDFSILEIRRKYFFGKSISYVLVDIVSSSFPSYYIPLKRGMMVCVSHVMDYLVGIRHKTCIGNMLKQFGGFLHSPLCCKLNYPKFGLQVWAVVSSKAMLD
jgi:hypothetical protein